MAGRKEAENRLVQIGAAHACGVGHHGAAGACGPAGGQIGVLVAALAALRAAVEIARAAAESEVEREVDQLGRDVCAAEALLACGNVRIGLPVAVGAVAVDRCGRGMGQPRGGDDADRLALRVRFVGNQGQVVPLRRRAVSTCRFGRDVEHAHAGLAAAVERGRGARAIGHLGVGVVGLDQRGVGEFLETERIFLAIEALLLPGENARCGDGGNAHSVADEQDDVLRLASRCDRSGACGRIDAVIIGRVAARCQRQRHQYRQDCGPARFHGMADHGRLRVRVSACCRCPIAHQCDNCTTATAAQRDLAHQVPSRLARGRAPP